VRTLIANGRIVAAEGLHAPGWLLVDGTRIADIGRGTPPQIPNASVLDASDHYVMPGMIDLHVHGGGGHEVMEAEPDGISGLARFLASRGITAFVPTTYTAEHAATMRALQRIADALGPIENGATNLGAHMEGPYLNARRKGAHRESLIRPADRREVDEYLSLGILRQMAVAPEIEGNSWLIDELVQNGITVAAGHTDATAAEMRAAAQRGVKLVTHVFNGMRGLHHREAGAAGAALALDQLWCELIADGVHVEPEVMRLVWHAKGRDRTVLITDINKAAGLPPNEVGLRFGRRVHVEGGVVRLEDGTISGSITTLDRGFANFLAATGASIAEAWPAVSLNPARAAGVADRKGSLEVGKDADIVVLSPDGDVTITIVEGRQISPV
jgi:N-acetylglucosamine-6-phosphate deacetylase